MKSSARSETDYNVSNTAIACAGTGAKAHEQCPSKPGRAEIVCLLGIVARLDIQSLFEGIHTLSRIDL